MDATQNKTWGWVWGLLIAAAVIGGIIWLTNSSGNNTVSQAPAGGSSGRLYVGVTDATADIKNVNDINVEVTKLEVHSTTDGWVTVSTDRKKFNLMALKNAARTELYAKADLAAGTYDRVRLTLGDVVVKTKAKGDVEAFLPGSQIVINMMINVAAEKDTRVQLDILADKSLHSDKSGKFVFATVVQAQAESNTKVTVSDDDEVMSEGGKVDSSASVGVDLSGNSRTNFNLKTDNDFKVDTSVEGGGTVKFIQGGKTFLGTTEDQEEAETSSGANVNTKTNANTNTDTNGGVKSDTDYKGTLNLNL